METASPRADDDPAQTDEGGPMRFLRRKKNEPEVPRCPVCRERLPEGAAECHMCGHPVRATDESERPEPVAPIPPAAPR